MVLRQYAAGWLCRQGRLAPNSLRAYTSVLRRHVLPALGDVPLPALTTPVVRAFLQAELARGQPRRSVQSYHAALSTVLTDAMIDGHIPTNPAHGASRRLWPRRGPMVQGLPLPDLHAVLLSADLDRVGWFGAFCRALVTTGLRLGEMLALRPGDLLPPVSALRVERTYHGRGEFGPPKGGRSRVVEIAADTLGLLMERAAGDQAYLWPRTDGRLPWSLSYCDLSMQRVVGHAGLPETVTLHALRHTYATLLLDGGADPLWVKQQLGHASIAITVDLYGAGAHGRRPDLLAGLAGIEPARHPPRSAKVANIASRRGSTRTA